MNVMKLMSFWNKKPQYQIIDLQSQTIPRKIVELFWLFVWKKHDPIQVAALLSDFYKKVTWTDLIEIDSAFRNNSFYYYSYDLKAEEPKSLLVPGLQPDFETILLCLCTMAPNGFFREKAVRNLNRFDDRISIPFLLLRLNDWVDPIRQLVAQEVEARTVRSNAETFLDYYGLIDRLRRSERANAAAICNRIDQTLRENTAIDYDYLKSRKLTGHVRNQLITNLVINQGASSEELIRIYRTESEPFLKFATLRQILAQQIALPLNVCVSLLQVKSSQKCKILLIEGIGTFDFLLTEPILQSAVFSRSVAIRRRARELLQGHVTSFVDIYADSLERRQNILTSIMGLSEVGIESDTKYLRPFLQSSEASERRSALIAIAKLSAQAISESIVDFLGDPGPGVSSVARRLILKHHLGIPLRQVEDIFSRSDYEVQGKNALLALVSASKWDSIYYILKYLEHSGDAGAVSRLHLRIWNEQYNRSFVEPMTEQIANVRKAIENLRVLESDTGVRAVLFALSNFERKES